ncbi:isochorismate pyruvate lyase [Tumebacillus sp. BK434]|uniref:chorismate mutase n=1 Tax=Tumebacillus sp. BK434 TaxID=2512169 RepID=UPI001050B386|nr:chorismate mutase [Tumebacillus sp. BK434]TCP54610.1 isochorismate pyruvate lyase [Tumebacillus sp. BK434]
MLDCVSIEEVRDCIDRIDDQVVRLLAERSHYVRLAMKFKKDASEANVPSRNQEILARVQQLSAAYDMDPGITKAVYRTMIEQFIHMQQQELSTQRDEHGQERPSNF